LPEGLDSLTSVITYQHGTIFKHADAPSVSFDLFGIAVAAQGMIAFVPDYIGFGASSSLFHPYLIAESYALPVADMIRSGQEFLNKKTIQTNDNLILIGYSEGAYATLAAQKEIESNPDLNISLTAVAVGSGSYDLQLTTETVFQDSTYEYPAYSAYVMLAYDQFYGLQRPLTDFFQEPYAGKLETLFNGINDGDDINSELTMMIDDLFNPVFKNAFLDAGEQDFKLLMTENNLTNWKPLTPTFLFHGTADNLVPFANSQMAYDNFVLNGSTSVTLIPLVDRDHETALLDMVLEINNLIPRL
ncbi:MAG: hypothetical protein KDD94_06330, partial [Calditrichaeota bacterium]|nr:hypothetical protein [Calditrichota bacterium]